jgi:hypothetical protein
LDCPLLNRIAASAPNVLTAYTHGYNAGFAGLDTPSASFLSG